MNRIRQPHTPSGTAAGSCPVRPTIAATVLLAATTVLLGGCQTMGGGMGGSSYSTRQVRTEQTVRLGTVESVREVEIQADDAAVGTVAGAVIGGAAASQIGGGRGSLITGVLGAVAGGMAGSAAEKGLRRTRGLEITVRLRNGDLIAVTQAYEPGDEFRAGDPVRILSGGGVTRVTR